jgi:hypothetical protein
MMCEDIMQIAYFEENNSKLDRYGQYNVGKRYS